MSFAQLFRNESGSELFDHFRQNRDEQAGEKKIGERNQNDEDHFLEHPAGRWLAC